MDDSILLRLNKNKNINFIKFAFYVNNMFILKIRVYTKENNSYFYKMIHKQQLVIFSCVYTKFFFHKPNQTGS